MQESDNLWWDAFATEFFEEDATLTLAFCLEDGPKRYCESIYFWKKKKTVFLWQFYLKFIFELSAIGRTLIPRYFRSIFEGGVTELYYNMKHPKESFHNTSITLDCDHCVMVTHHAKPMFTKVRFLLILIFIIELIWLFMNFFHSIFYFLLRNYFNSN